MTTTDIRREIKNRLNKADDRLLKMVFALIKEYETEDDFDIPTAEIKKSEQRMKLYKQGKIKAMTAAEASVRIRKNLKK